MKILPALIKVLDRLTGAIGVSASYFSILMVLVTCYIVVARYVFNAGSIAVQEVVIYLNAMLVLLTAAFTLKQDGHVRVDIFFSAAAERYKAWVNLLGGIFLLLPVTLFILWASWDYVMAAWRIREQSASVGGLPFVYLLKTLILVMAASLLLQGLAEIGRNFLRLFPARGAPLPEADSAGDGDP